MGDVIYFKRESNQKAQAMATEATRVISITSGKGGVGKTHMCVNIGLALAKLGKKVLLLDADLGLANINVMLGFQPQATLRDVLSGDASLSDVVVSHPAGFDVIPATSGVQEMTLLSQEERYALLSAVEGFGGDYDYLLVDTAAGIGDNVIYFNVAAEKVFVVIDHEPTTITDAYALVKVMSTEHGVQEFHVLVNRCPIGTDGRTTFSQLAQVTDKFLSVSLKYLGSVAEDEVVMEAVVAQKPFMNLYPSSKASLHVKKIADKIVSQEGTRVPTGGMQFFFRSLMENS